MLQIKDFPEKLTRDNNDLILIQEASNACKKIKISTLIFNLSANASSNVLWNNITTNSLLTHGSKNIVSSASGNITLTLPNGASGSEIRLFSRSSLNNVFLVNGQKINGRTITSSSTVKLKFNIEATLVYLDDSIGWLSLPGNSLSIITNLALPTAGLTQVFNTTILDLANNTLVESWLDSQGTRHATQSTVANRPTFFSSYFNNGNLPGIYFNGSNFFTTDLSYLVNQKYTIAVVESRVATGNYYLFGNDASSTNSALHIGYRDNLNFTLAQFSNDLNASITGYSNQVPTIWVVSNNSRGKEIWRNNNLLASSSNTVNLSSSANGRLGRALNTNYLGYLGLVSVWVGDKSQNEINQIFTAINNTFEVY